MTGYVHILAPEVTRRAVRAGDCPDCNRRSRFISFHQDWYGWRQTCLRCGRTWDDGEWLPLDFERGARRKSIERAKAWWRRLTRDSRLKREAPGREAGPARKGESGGGEANRPNHTGEPT